MKKENESTTKKQKSAQKHSEPSARTPTATGMPATSEKKKNAKEIAELLAELQVAQSKRSPTPPSPSSDLCTWLDAQIATETQDCLHFHGKLVDSPDILKMGQECVLKTPDKTLFLNISSDSLVQVDLNMFEQEVHVLARCVHNDLFAKVICSNDFYNQFYHIESFGKKISFMNRYLKLPLEKQIVIEQQLRGQHHELAQTDKSIYFEGKEELQLKYELCKATYTPEQQRAIEKLFSQYSVSKSKANRRLEYVLNISPTIQSARKFDYAGFIQGLDAQLYKLENVKQKLAECFVANAHTKEGGLRILLVGRSGVGKTSFAKAIAAICGLPFGEIKLGGVDTALDLMGLVGTYSEADFGKFLKTFYSIGTTQAVIVLDELDKMGRHGTDGNPADCMLDTLSDVHTFYDSFLEMSVDTRNTIYIATANSTLGIPDYLLNRFEVIHIDDYADQDKIDIAKKYLLPSLLQSFHIQPDELVIADDTLDFIIKNYCYDSGARMLKDHLKTIVRRVVTTWEQTALRQKTAVDEAFVRSALDACVNPNEPKLIFHRNKAHISPEMKKELDTLFATLDNPDLEAYKKESTLKRIQYFTALLGEEDNTPPSFDAEHFYTTVNTSHYGLGKVKEQLAKHFFAQSMKAQSFSSERILLVGGPGIGKSSICESIAEGLQIEYIKISLNGLADEHALKGFVPSYKDADAGAIVKGISRVKSTKVLIQLDEPDKLGSHNGTPVSNCLFDLLDDAANFIDHYLGVAIDLSNVLFIATANDISNMNPCLLDRFQIFNLEGYSTSDKQEILVKHFIPKLEREYASIALDIKMTPSAIDCLTHEYCTSFGVRELEKFIERIVEDKLYKAPDTRSMTINLDDIASVLGPKPLPRGNLLSENVPGFSKALAVTGNNAGMAFSIESAIIPNDTRTCITGLPMDSAIDSVKLAKTYIRIHCMQEAKDFGLHLHFGEGAVKKDGPSAGVAILISILSAVYDQPVAENCAYTGEIDLFGNIFAVGGSMAKIRAAQETACQKVFIPQDNYAQLTATELSNFDIEVIPVTHVSQVIESVFPQNKTIVLQM